MKSVPGIDNNFTYDGKSFHISGDGRVLNRKINSVTQNVLKGKIIQTTDIDEIFNYRYHMLTSKLCLALNNASRSLRSMHKMLRIKGSNNEDAKERVALLARRSAAKSIARPSTELKEVKINPGSIVKLDWVLNGMPEETINNVMKIGSGMLDKDKVKKTMAIKNKYGITPDAYKKLMKIRNSNKNVLNHRVTAVNVGNDPSWSEIALDGTPLNIAFSKVDTAAFLGPDSKFV
jgi:hypothetical protein